MSGRFAAWVLTTRPVVRAPIWLYRAGLGFVFGGRLLMLEHIGRTSGEPRYVVLEVADRPAPDEAIIASGFGYRAQWLRNLVANPGCRVSIGFRRRMPAVATVIDPAESARLLSQYQRRHPRTWQQLEAAIVHATGDAEPVIPLVRLALQRGSADPGR